MDSPVTKLIFIAAAVAASVLVVAVMWTTLSNTRPPNRRFRLTTTRSARKSYAKPSAAS